MIPTTTASAIAENAPGIAATISAATMLWLGLDYYALVYALIGAFVAVYQTDSLPWKRATIFVILSTIVGAALGTALVTWVGSTQRVFLLVACIVGGAGSQVIVAKLINVVLDKLSGDFVPKGGKS